MVSPGVDGGGEVGDGFDGEEGVPGGQDGWELYEPASVGLDVDGPDPVDGRHERLLAVGVEVELSAGVGGALERIGAVDRVAGLQVEEPGLTTSERG